MNETSDHVTSQCFYVDVCQIFGSFINLIVTCLRNPRYSSWIKEKLVPFSVLFHTRVIINFFITIVGFITYVIKSFNVIIIKHRGAIANLNVIAAQYGTLLRFFLTIAKHETLPTQLQKLKEWCFCRHLKYWFS